MSCTNCSDNSSLTYSRCNPPVSTNCVFYQGESKVCASDNTFTVCKGDNLSDVQSAIFDKICAIAGEVNITSIEFPCSLQDAWEDEDPTILNLLQYMVTIQCEQKSSIDDIKTDLGTLDPIVSVCLECCEPGCGTASIQLSQALNKIIECICNVKTTAEQALENSNAALYAANETLAAKVEAQKILIDSLVLAQPGILNRLCKIEKYFTNEGIELPTC